MSRDYHDEPNYLSTRILEECFIVGVFRKSRSCPFSRLCVPEQVQKMFMIRPNLKGLRQMRGSGTRNGSNVARIVKVRAGDPF